MQRPRNAIDLKGQGKLPQKYQLWKEIKWQETTEVRESNVTMVLPLLFFWGYVSSKEVIQHVYFIVETEIQDKLVL